MKKFSYLLFMGIVLVLTSCHKDKVTNTNITNLTATINGASEETANSSTATGSANGTYDASTKMLMLTITYSGLTPTAGHIHKGAVGVSGGVIFPFSSLNSPISFMATLDATQEADLLAGLYYINFHTTAFPGGEIRGQILKK